MLKKRAFQHVIFVYANTNRKNGHEYLVKDSSEQTTSYSVDQLDRTDLFDSSTMTIMKEALLNHITSADMGTYRLTIKLKPGIDLPTGTYRIMYNLYNGNKLVGDVYTYIIIKD